MDIHRNDARASIDRTAPRDCADEARTRVIFLTLPGYSLMAVSGAIDVLRLGNEAIGQDAYTWQVASMDGAPVASGNGLGMAQTVALGPTGPADILLVCGGMQVAHATTPELRDTLRDCAGRGTRLGALCTGVHALACAGLLDGYRAVAHWEYLHELTERYPAVHFLRQIFELDRDRFTCAGSMSAVDMVLGLVGLQLGPQVCQQISQQLLMNRLRDATDRQPSAAQPFAGLYSGRLREVVALMEANIEEPLPLAELSRLSGVSTRQIERLFRQYLDKTPTSYYMDLRMHKARELLTRTPISIIEVSMACGFQTHQHFSSKYRRFFGLSPSEQRRRAMHPVPVVAKTRPERPRMQPHRPDGFARAYA